MATEVIEPEAAQSNRMVMNNLKRAIGADPKVDLASKLDQRCERFFLEKTSHAGGGGARRMVMAVRKASML